MLDHDLHPLYSNRVIGGQSIDTSTWVTPDEGALLDEIRSAYLARKVAVSLYLQGFPAAHIKNASGLSAKQAYRLIRERCLETHSDGQPYGWRGLMPYLRIQPFTRISPIRPNKFGNGAVGAMQTVLNTHPQLRMAFDKRIASISAGKKLEEIKLSTTRHCTWFLDELRRLGYEQRGEWPFNTASTAYYSVRRYVAKCLSSNPKALAATTGSTEAVRKLKTGNGSDRPVTRFLQRVEMDAHKLDGRFCVSMPEIGGGTKERIVHRLWVIVLIDVVSRVVLGYFMSIGKEVSANDVLRAIKRSLVKWVPRPVSFSEHPYRPGAGLLSSLGEDFVGLCWEETSVDGALAETCKSVATALRDAVGSVLLTPDNSFSKRRSLDDRPFIEAFFRNIAGKGFQRLSNTTGGKASERKERNPEAVALTSRFQYEYAEEILDVLIANYNATPHSGIGKRTPLAYAKFLYECGQTSIRHADPSTVESLLSVRKLCRVCGGAKVGRSVYVDFFYARYTNELLQNRQDLVGSSIWVINHKEDDARVVLASSKDGMPLGVLRAGSPWHISPHSLTLRKAIYQAQAHGKFHVTASADAIESFLTYVESQPQKKLPIHPAYLEARRILSAASNQFVGETILQAARQRANAKIEESAGMLSSVTNNFSLAEAAKKASVLDTKAESIDSMPPRRLAATKPKA